MSNYERTARIEGIDVATGVFEMTLATEGEASDGHILSIKGGQVPERMPLLNSHFNSPTDALGSITEPRKFLKDSPPRLQVRAQIETGGVEPQASIRRDLLHMIEKGHVSQASIRWDEVPGKSIRRINLPSDHPYYVDSEKATGPERWGVFFEEWIGREGSIVGLGSDPGALIARADETEGDVSTYWRAMAEDAATPKAEEPTDEGKAAAAVAGLRLHIADCREAGISPADCAEAVTEAGGFGPWRLVHASPPLAVASDGHGNALNGLGESIKAVALADLRGRLTDCREVGCEDDEIAEVLKGFGIELPDIPAALPRDDEAALDLEPEPERGADPPAPTAPTDLSGHLELDAAAVREPLDVRTLVGQMRGLLDEADRRRHQAVNEMLRQVLGRVS